MGLAAISYDPAPVLAEFSARRGITFPLLSDAGSAVITRFGLLNTTITTTNPLYGYPFPGTFVVNRDGIVTARFFEEAYQERDTITSVMLKLGEGAGRPGTRVSAPHLEIATYASDDVVAPGTHFSLVLDVSPAHHVHVYAPGVTGYKPIGLRIEPQPGLVVRSSRYPKPEDYHFKPLNEHVPVFQRPFRIVQDLEIDPSREVEAALKDTPSLTIKTSLDYQACDDKVCFTPQSVPLSWTVSLRTLDRERVKR